MSAHDDPHAIQMGHENPSSYQNPTSTVALRVESHPLSSNVVHPHEEDQFRLRWSFFFLLSFLSQCLGICI
jgi:hypothetical protein